MFIRTKTTQNSPRKSVQIVENKRDGSKVKQVILRHVGIAMDDIEEAKLTYLAEEIMAKIMAEREKESPCLPIFEAPEEAEMLQAIRSRPKKGRKPKKKLEEILPIQQVSLDDVIEKSRIVDGVHEIAGHLYDTMGYGKLLRRRSSNNILKDLVLCRISNPKSKRGTQRLLHYRDIMRERT